MRNEQDALTGARYFAVMHRRTAIVGVALGALAHGCLLFTDLGAYDAVDPGTSDATSESAPSDDATAAGDSSAGDSSVIGQDAGDGGAALGCTGSDAAFCADFDDGGLTPLWTELESTGGGVTVESSTALSNSPPKSFHSAIDRAVINPAVGDCAYARVARDLANLGPRMRARFSFDVWLGSATGPVETDGILVGHLKTSKDCNFILALDDTSCGVIFQFPRNGGRIEDNVTGTLPAPIGKAWAHMALDVSFDPAAPAWSLSVNGQACGVTKVMPPECLSAQTFYVAPGVYCEDKGTGVVEIYVDNVEVR